MAWANKAPASNQFITQPFTVVSIELACPPKTRLVPQGSNGRHLGECVHIEWRANLIDMVSQTFRHQSIPTPEACKPISLGEGSQDDSPRTGCQDCQSVRAKRWLNVLKIGFIKHQNGALFQEFGTWQGTWQG